MFIRKYYIHRIGGIVAEMDIVEGVELSTDEIDSLVKWIGEGGTQVEVTGHCDACGGEIFADGQVRHLAVECLGG